jgi:hypothetical protein
MDAARKWPRCHEIKEKCGQLLRFCGGGGTLCEMREFFSPFTFPFRYWHPVAAAAV